MGIEPTYHDLKGRCSVLLATHPLEHTAGVEPASSCFEGKRLIHSATCALVDPVGIEPTTSGLRDRRSPLAELRVYVLERP